MRLRIPLIAVPLLLLLESSDIQHMGRHSDVPDRQDVTLDELTEPMVFSQFILITFGQARMLLRGSNRADFSTYLTAVLEGARGQFAPEQKALLESYLPKLLFRDDAAYFDRRMFGDDIRDAVAQHIRGDGAWLEFLGKYPRLLGVMWPDARAFDLTKHDCMAARPPEECRVYFDMNFGMQGAIDLEYQSAAQFLGLLSALRKEYGETSYETVHAIVADVVRRAFPGQQTRR